MELPLLSEFLASKLLERTSGNRMAVEYRLAIALLPRDLRGVAAVLARMDSAAYPTLPPLYEEALLIHGISCPTSSSRPAVESPSAVARSAIRRWTSFAAFGRSLTRGGPNEKAESAVAARAWEQLLLLLFLRIEEAIVNRRSRNLICGVVATALLALLIAGTMYPRRGAWPAGLSRSRRSGRPRNAYRASGPTTAESWFRPTSLR